MRNIVLCAALSLVASTAAQADHHRSFKLLGDIEVYEGEKQGNIRTVNGDLRLEDSSEVKNAKTVNGSIRFGENVVARTLSTVNGDIRGEQNLSVEEDVSTVNGSIRLLKGSTVGHSVRSVNGTIKLNETTVGKDVTTTNGDIRLFGTRIDGDIIFEDAGKDHGHWKSKPTLYIDADSVVNGNIILKQEVKLEIEDGASVGQIVRS